MIAIIIVGLILLIVLLYFKKSNDTIEEFLDESNGTFDEPARKAYSGLKAKSKRTARDNINLADVVRYNGLNNDIRGLPDGNAIVRDIANTYIEGAAQLPPEDAQIPAVAERMRNMRDMVDPFQVDYELMAILDNTTNAATAIDNRAIAARKQKAFNAADAANAANAANARGKPPQKTDIATEYFKETAAVTSDRQNVHDSQVNEDLRKTLRHIRTESVGGVGPQAAIAAAREYSRGKQSVGEILDIIAQGATITALGDTEDAIFAAVWNRADHPTNMFNTSEIKDAIIAAIEECKESGGVVCANGRCARIIGALSVIDSSEEIGRVGSFDMYKNAIIKESEEIMQKTLDSLRHSVPSKVQRWSDGEDEPQITERIKEEINRNIDNYRDKLSPTSLAAIRNLCLAAVE